MEPIIGVDSEFRPADHPQRWYERFPRGLPVGIFVLTLGITAISVAAIERAETMRRSAELDQTAQSIGAAIERRAGVSASSLRAGAALISTQREFDPTLFGAFIDQLGWEAKSTGAVSFGWAGVVAPDRIAATEAEMSRLQGSPFRVYPAWQPGRPHPIPTLYIRPGDAENRAKLGFDLASEAVRRKAVEGAIRSEGPTISDRVALLQHGRLTGPPGFAMYMAVFGAAPDGRRFPRGVVFTAFDARAFVNSAVDLGKLGTTGLAIYDDGSSKSPLLAIAPAGGPVVRLTRDLALLDRHWTLVISQPAPRALSMTSLITLLFGLLVATLLLVLARLVTTQAAEDRLALEWFEHQNSIRNSLVRELNHRVKNTLANVLSILALTRRRSTSLDNFADSLDGRIRALSATHDLLTQSDWGATPIRSLIEVELAPYVREQGRALKLEGPDVELAPGDALSLGLAVHELATNAAKYGALSVESGMVSVTWSLPEPGIARIEWTERGGPAIDTTRAPRKGFGTELIQKIVAHELHHPVDLRFTEQGVECVLQVPVRRIGTFTMRAKGS